MSDDPSVTPSSSPDMTVLRDPVPPETPAAGAEPAIPAGSTAQAIPAGPTTPAIPAEPTTPVGPAVTPPFPPPLPPSGFFVTVWPGPAGSGGLAVPVAVLVGALGFAMFVPLTRLGIGWVIGGAVAAVAVAVVAGRAHAAMRVPDRIWRAVWGSSALALLSVLAFRNAWWLVTFCVMGALGCASVAIMGGRAIRTILFGLVGAPFAALRGLPWLARHLSSRDKDPSAAPARIGRAVWSVVVTVVLLLIFVPLLTSADAAFNSVVSDLLPSINGATVFRWIFLFIAGAGCMVAATYLVSAPPDLASMEKPGKGRLDRTEWGLPIGALVVLFTGFVVVQMTVLFGGSRHVLETAGLTYAEYARSGFWQLVAVTILTLLVVAGTARWARRDSGGSRIMVRALLGALSGLSLVIVASAVYRMYTYQRVYSFTGERVFVMAFELLLGAVFAMILAAGIRLNGSWVPRGMVAATVAMLLTLAVLNPELYAAQRNIERYNETGKIDLWYLRALSADATPALVTLPDDLRRCALMWISDSLSGSDPWYGWNLGRERARELLRELGPAAIGDCSKARQYDYTNTR
jgi:Domain of unknown function (DUF4173)